MSAKQDFELRRTEIACVCFAGQILCCICFAYNSSYFFQNVGLGTSPTYSLALGGTALALVGCFVNCFGKSDNHFTTHQTLTFDLHLPCPTSAAEHLRLGHGRHVRSLNVDWYSQYLDRPPLYRHDPSSSHSPLDIHLPTVRWSTRMGSTHLRQKDHLSRSKCKQLDRYHRQNTSAIFHEPSSL